MVTRNQIEVVNNTTGFVLRKCFRHIPSNCLLTVKWSEQNQDNVAQISSVNLEEYVFDMLKLEIEKELLNLEWFKNLK